MYGDTMKKLFIAALLFFFSAARLCAQNPTNVTGTITDANSIAYYPATVLACLSPTTTDPIVGGKHVNNNIGSNYCVGSVPTTPAGSFSMGLHANANITPAATTWIFYVQASGSAPPAGTGAQAFQSSGITIAGTSQDIGATLSALAPKLTAGGSGITANSPVPAKQQQGPAYNVQNFGAVGDAKSSKNCASTATTTITSTDNPWVAGDVGKKFQMVVTGISDFGAVGGGNANNEVTITTFNSAGSIVVSASSTQTGTGACVWYTQQDQTAMLAAYTAADCGAQKAFEPAYGSPTICRPGRVFIPKGGYVVCGTIYNDITHAGNNTEGVSLIGEAGTDIYVAPCFVPPNGSASVGTLILAYLNQRAEFGPFHIYGLNFLNTNLSAQQSLFGTLSSGKTWVHDVTITNWGSSQAGTSAAFGMTNTSAFSRIDNLQVQSAPTGDFSVACVFNNAGVDIFSTFCSNHFINLLIQASGQRTVVGPHFVLHGYQNDECGTNGLACMQLQNSTVNCVGCELLNPSNGVGSVSVDTTSALYLTDSTMFTFNVDGGNSSGVILAGNGQVFATGSNFSGNNASAAIAGPATSKFWDLSGNLIYNQVAGVLTPCTVANFLTCAFSGGVTPTFPLLANATTQLGARQVVTGTAPTFAVTGFGTGPTVTVQTGSTDAAGAAVITAGTTPGATGTFTVTFTTLAGAYGTNPPVCTFTLVNGTGSWNALAQEPIVQTPATTSVIANWSNNAVNLTAASTYGFNWSCYGK
jgi:hypothetical protein